jgi:hypothetical protein
VQRTSLHSIPVAVLMPAPPPTVDTSAAAKSAVSRKRRPQVTKGRCPGESAASPWDLPPTPRSAASCFRRPGCREANQRVSTLAAELPQRLSHSRAYRLRNWTAIGKILYLAAKGLAATRVKWESKWCRITGGNDLGLDKAIEPYKAAWYRRPQPQVTPCAGVPSSFSTRQ